MALILTDVEPRGLGYLEVDNRACDLPPGATRYFEGDTYTCTHCQYVVIMNPKRKRVRAKCKGCNHHICDACGELMKAGASCKTFAQKVEENLEREARQLAQGSLLVP